MISGVIANSIDNHGWSSATTNYPPSLPLPNHSCSWSIESPWLLIYSEGLIIHDFLLVSLFVAYESTRSLSLSPTQPVGGFSWHICCLTPLMVHQVKAQWCRWHPEKTTPSPLPSSQPGPRCRFALGDAEENSDLPRNGARDGAGCLALGEVDGYE